jgi:uncharacterized protein (TIGR03066 family)
MKNSIKAKKQQQKPERAEIAAPQKSLARWAVLTCCLIVAAGGSWAFAEFVLWNKLPPELVGKWVVVGGEQDGATFDFYRSGTMVGNVNVQGRHGIVNATVAVEGDKLLTTTRNPSTGREETRSQTIKTLNRRSLELVDARGLVLNLIRAN